MIYESIPEFTAAQMEKIVAENDDIKKLIFVPLFASLYYEDRSFAEKICVKLSAHPDEDVRAAAVEGLEHIARIDGKLNKETIKPIIEKALKDKSESVRLNAEMTRDATKQFLKWRYKK